MKIFIDETDFHPWSGAIPTYDLLKEEGRLNDFWALFEELYPDGLSDTGVNDILWFESEWIWEALGMKDPYADPEDAEDNRYEEFCGKYTCDTCPLNDAEDCSVAFNSIRVSLEDPLGSFEKLCTDCSLCPMYGIHACIEAYMAVAEVLNK